MYQQNQMQMAAHPQQQQAMAVQVQPGHPPFTPQLPNVPGELQPYYAYIVSVLIIELQNKMSANAARMHAFNLMANNGYQTTEFVNFVGLYVQYLDAWMRVGPGSQNSITIEQAIQATMPDYVGAYCLASVQDFGYIMQFLDPNTQQYVNAAINSMQGVLQMIAQAANQGGYGRMQQVHNGHMSGGHFPSHAGRMGAPRTINTGMAQASGSTAGAQGLFDNNRNAQQPQRTQQAMGHPGGKSRYSAQLDKMLEEQDAKRNGGRTQGYTAPGTSGQATTVPTSVVKTAFRMPKDVPGLTTIKEGQDQKTEVAAPSPAPTPTPPKELKWKPSEHQPYRVLYDFTKFKEELRVVDGVTISVMIPLKPEEVQNMNIEDHALTRPPVPRFDATGLDGKGVELPTDEIPVVPKFELEFHSAQLMELSTDISKVLTGLRYKLSKQGTDRAAAKCYTAIIVNLLSVTDKDKASKYNDLIRRLGACQTFKEGILILDEIADLKDDRLFFNQLDRLLAEELNVILTMNIGGMRIDSFYHDASEVLPAIVKKRGEAVAQSFAANQKRFFRQLMSDIDETQLAENTQFMLSEYVNNDKDDESNWEPGLTTLAWETSFTHLMVPSYELNITLAPGAAGVLTEKTTPELYSLADQLLTMPDGDDIRRHYITTSDGLTLMLARGYLNDQAYLVRRVREIA